MTSTFFGLETAYRGLTAQQSALSTVAQNVSNANTPGYTRQRVNMVATDAFPSPGMNSPQIAGTLGTGVTTGSVQRIRDQFLDTQYRGQNTQLGEWSAKSDALSQMENIMNEPSDSGLSATMGQFYQSLQDLSTNPEDEGSRSVVLQNGTAVADTFHYINDSLTSIQGNLGDQIGSSVTDINSTLQQISDLNKQIGTVEANGNLPNDLYDQRDNLVDQLSSYMNIKVDRVPSGGNASAMAEGQYNISMVNPDGSQIQLVQKGTNASIAIKGGIDTNNDGIPDRPNGNQAVSAITVSQLGDPQTVAKEIGISTNGTIGISAGKLSGLIENFGYTDTTTDAQGNAVTSTKGYYPQMMDNLDKLAYTFGTVFNAVQDQGYDLNGQKGTDFFTFGSLSDYHGAAAAINEVSNLTTSQIAAASSNTLDSNGKPIAAKAGDGNNAINLAGVQDYDLSKPITLGGGMGTLDLSANSSNIFQTGTISSNYQGMIGKLGVDSQQASRLSTNSTTLLQSVDNNRQSVSSVSIDEEMTNMIKYQQAYSASARMVTMMDDILDKVVNGLGTGGR
ncbi:flagellar hook-associated protein FlgK [Heyndrickxia acidicola]|uniref:Flagellar hook-associated protein 1 n=1 Tax=Heyndrickxia acidicola TaxID=209389 RepID=A0ABU6MI82_9BACI|nr:flagellar hook-associated protein FlgK [Heyndrickxia acidicola]MED1204376.1 flagellar hook-associated protein FlgK [Heyndrickxia acidicola]